MVSDLAKMNAAVNQAYGRREQGELPATPALEAFEAWLHKNYGITQVYEVGEHRLMLLDSRLIDGSGFDGSHLAWRISVEAKNPETGTIAYWTAFVDVDSETVLLTMESGDGLQAPVGDYSVSVKDAEGTRLENGDWDNCFGDTGIFDDGAPTVCLGGDGDPATDCQGHDQPADGDAQDFVSHSAEFDAVIYSLIGLDVPESPNGGSAFYDSGTGSQFLSYRSVVNVPMRPDWDAYYNSTCNQARFKGYSTDTLSLSLVAHELTHQVVRFQGDFSTNGEANALDEHYSHIFSDIIADRVNGTSGAIMCNVTSDCADGWHCLNGICQPRLDVPGGKDRWDLPNMPDEHDQARVMNQVFRLLVNGGTFNGYKFPPLGFNEQDVARLVFDTLHDGNVSFHSDFEGYRDGTMAEARTDASLALSSHQICLLRNAFASVGYGRNTVTDHDCDGSADYDDADGDGDGISNGQDNCPLYMNPNQRDMDGDEIGDACDDDIDGDGITNNPELGPVDPCPGAAPIQPDATDNYSLEPTSSHRLHDPDPTDDDDQERVADACSDIDGDHVDGAEDTCPYTYNASQLDTDGDGKGDPCDDDDDNDGIDDVLDNCELTPNPDQANVDGDARGDVCDDDDYDGIFDVDDNCRVIHNPSQRDFDGDGLGDDCDQDIDNDGILNAADLCPSDPYVTDTTCDITCNRPIASFAGLS